MCLGGKQCTSCGAELDGVETAGGVIYECGTHGVRDWVFEDQTHTEYALRVPRAPVSRLFPERL
ncbi:MAG TPA: hypothetical protein VM681_09215 [Candidatus Thermoplasmatota archaeon]|nr:hypothetical protein [Candidatus Thermoplasmatota archaeon]